MTPQLGLQADNAEVEPVAEHADKLEILLVEDNPGDVQLTRRLLRDVATPLNFTVAEDGQAALECLRRQGARANTPRPDLILLDLNMPKKDGLQVLEEMNADQNLRTIPVLILTSRQQESDTLANLGMHPSRWTNKPIDVERFNRLINGLQYAPTAATAPRRSPAAEPQSEKKRHWFGRRG